MRRRFLAVIVCGALLFGKAAWAHRIDEYLQATIFSLQANRVDASMRMIPGVLVASSVIDAVDSNHDGVFSDAEERVYAQSVLREISIAIDGKNVSATLRSWSFPAPVEMRQGMGEIKIEYSVELPRAESNRTLVIANHYRNAGSVYLMNVEVPQDPGIRIVAQKRNPLQSVYELDYQQGNEAAAGSGRARLLAWIGGLQVYPLFRLGMRHIAEGTDHLLFLLVLLLPAPLLATGSRWARVASVRQSLLHILGIVTAFTIGHSITLSLAAMGFVHVAERPIEVLIAVSILISAVHALRPIFPGRESWIAAFFGLIHGLAFAATLDRLGVGRWERVVGILSFNLGIETMQMLVVAAILPSLLLMSRTRAYPMVRVGGAVFAGVASVGWIAERTADVPLHVDAVVNVFARHAVGLAVTLFVLSLVCRYIPADRREGSVETETRKSLVID